MQLEVYGVTPQLPFELRGRALGDDPPAVHDGQPGGELVGLVEVVGGQQDGDRLVRGEPADLGPHLCAPLRVEAGRRLVEEEHARLVNQGQRHVEAPLHAARPATDRAVRGLGQVEALQQLVHPPASADAEDPRLQSQVVAAAGHRVQRRPLGDDADLAAHPLRMAQHVVAGDGRPAGIRTRERGQDLDGAGLAGAVRPEQAEHLAGADGEGEPVEGPHPAGIGLSQVFCRYGITHGDPSPDRHGPCPGYP